MRKRRTRKSLDGKTPTSARRSTRVSRISIGEAGSTCSTEGTDGNNKRGITSSRLRNKHRLSLSSQQPCQKWACVLRPPRHGVGFKTMKWVPVSELSVEERIIYNEEMEEKRKRMGNMLDIPPPPTPKSNTTMSMGPHDGQSQEVTLPTANHTNIIISTSDENCVHKNNETDKTRQSMNIDVTNYDYPDTIMENKEQKSEHNVQGGCQEGSKSMNDENDVNNSTSKKNEQMEIQESQHDDDNIIMVATIEKNDNNESNDTIGKNNDNSQTSTEPNQKFEMMKQEQPASKADPSADNETLTVDDKNKQQQPQNQIIKNEDHIKDLDEDVGTVDQLKQNESINLMKENIEKKRKLLEP